MSVVDHVLRARMALVADRVAPLLTTECDSASSLDADVQRLAAMRLVSNFEGYADDRAFDGTYADVVDRALDDERYAASDPALLRACNALRDYDRATVAVFEAYPAFRDAMHTHTTLGLFQVTDWLWRNDTHVRALCDVEGVSLQKVPRSQPTTPEQRAIGQAECKRLRASATSLAASAKLLRARANTIEGSISGGGGACPCPTTVADDDFKLLLHGRSLVEFPYSAIPVRAGQQLTLRLPACVSPSLSHVDPSTSYAQACVESIEYFPTALPRDGMAFVDIVVPTPPGRYYLLDRTSIEVTRQFAGAHLYVLNSADPTSIGLCATAERVLKRPREHF